MPKMLLTLFLTLVSAFGMITGVAAYDVVVVHSYNHGFQWTDDVDSTLRETLKETYPYIQIDSIYLDLKKNHSTEYRDLLPRYLHARTKGRRYDCVVVSDNAAFNIVTKHRHSLLKDTPLVFLGLNGYSDVSIAGMEDITGVVETVDMEKTITLMMMLQPELEEIVVVSDMTTTGAVNYALFDEIMKKRSYPFKTKVYNDTHHDEIIAYLKSTPLVSKERAILFLSYYQTPDGMRVDPEVLLDPVHELSIPVYSNWDFLLKKGVVGGYMVNGIQQGTVAAELVRKILTGTPVEAIPVVTTSPNRYYVNIDRVHGYGLEGDNLPEGTQVMYAEQEYVPVAREIIVLVSGIAFILIVIIANIAIVARRRKKTARELDGNRNFLNTLLETIPVPVFVKNTNGIYLRVNRSFESFLGISRKNVEGYHVRDIVPEEKARVYEIHDRELLLTRRYQVYDSQVTGINGVEKDVQFHKDIYYHNGRVAGIVGCIIDVSAIREARSRYKFMVENQRDIFFQMDTEGKILYLSSSVYTHSGYHAEELQGTSFYEYVHKDDHAIITTCFAQLLEGGDEPCEFRLLDSEGTIHFIRSSSRMVIDEKGFRTIQGILIDITDEKLLATAAHQSEINYRSLFKNMFHGFAYHRVITDDTGKPVDFIFLEVNEAYETMTGLKKGVIIGRKVTEVIPGVENDSASWISRFGKVAVTGESETFTEYFSGTDRWFRISVFCPQKDYFTVLVDDVTEELKARELIDNSRQQLRLLADSVQLQIWYLSDVDVYGIVNAAHAEFLGASQESFEDASITDFFSDDEAKVLIAGNHHVFFQGEEYAEEVWLRNNRGDLRLLSITRIPKIDEKGKVEFVICSAQDITSQHNNQERLLRAVNDTREAIKRAEEATKAKSRFLANMSHEIRTPMNAIVGMTELALMTEDDVERWEYLNTVKESSHHLTTVLNDIIDISRVEEGKLTITEKNFRLDMLLDGIYTSMKQSAVAKGIDFTVEYPDTIETNLKGDPDRIRQILINLVSNAIKFTSMGRVVLRVTQKTMVVNDTVLPEKHGWFSFTVEDTGIGIEEKDIAHIFNAFSQADDSITRMYGGTGLGLSITKELLKLMNGTVQVHSTPGKGSLFTIEIPLNIADDDNGTEDSKASKKGNDRVLKILLAEDNRVNQRIAVLMLERMGHRVSVAENGKVALEYLNESEYDLVLMDIEMPEMDGIEATRRIRRGECGTHLGDIPIVAMSAHAIKEVMDESLDAGMNDYITKPVSVEELNRVIDEISELQSRRD